jgi:hypothetical protein
MKELPLEIQESVAGLEVKAYPEGKFAYIHFSNIA